MAQPKNDKIVAGLLALFLGGIGIHKFYLGRTGQGVLYLVFCWTGIPMVAGLIEALIYLTMSHEEFDEKYNLPNEDLRKEIADLRERVLKAESKGPET